MYVEILSQLSSGNTIFEKIFSFSLLEILVSAHLCPCLVSFCSPLPSPTPQQAGTQSAGQLVFNPLASPHMSCYSICSFWRVKKRKSKSLPDSL